MMKTMLAVALTLALALGLTGCSKKEDTLTPTEEQQRNELVGGMVRDGSLQEGANVTTKRDADGSIVVNYENPDGTGGGGVILD